MGYSQSPNLHITFVLSIVPEPSTFVLAALGLRLITVPAVAPLSGPKEVPAPARIDRGTLHDDAIGEIDKEQEDLADTDPDLPDLAWLDTSDLPATQGRSSKIAASALTAVEKVVATL